MVTFDEEKQKKQLEELRLVEQEDLARLLAEKYSVPYIDLSATSINTDALRLIPEEISHSAKIVAFEKVGKKITVAALSPKEKNALAVIQELEDQGLKPDVYIATEKSLERAWERYSEIKKSLKVEAGVLDIGDEKIEEYISKVEKIDDLREGLEKMLASKERFQTTSLLELFIAGTLATKASDIHFEPKEKNVKTRLRIDGVLQDLVSVDNKVYKLLLSRIKLLSSLKINIQKEAQDGRFSIKFEDTEIEIRTSIIPGAYGESIVLRVLNPKTINVPLEELGMNEKTLTSLKKEIGKPNGMILNTGPTGSGKTTTLYAFLKKLSTPEIKIITIEDPIEYHLPNITQTQTDTDKGYTFLEGLRSSLRQDPDVIMVGEIRDSDTAGTAINAALTGHLVLSTLHTNTAAGAIPRLIDLKVNPKIIGSALSAVIAQRLVRKLCGACRVEEDPTKEERELLLKIISEMPEEDRLPVSKIWRAKGCSECNNTGYTGRIGIYEVIIVDEKIEEIIIQNPSEREIRKVAAHQGLLDMRQDGVIKILSGITSLEELNRVLDVEEEIG